MSLILRKIDIICIFFILKFGLFTKKYYICRIIYKHFMEMITPLESRNKVSQFYPYLPITALLQNVFSKEIEIPHFYTLQLLIYNHFILHHGK